MACHVYNSLYCKVMTIAVCDMQSEDCIAQVHFWRNLNSVVQRHGEDDIEFKGFMADSAQANWNAVRIVYGGGDPTIPMENRERTCLFHKMQFLEKHTKAKIKGVFKISVDCNSASNTRMPCQWRSLRFGTLLSGLGGYLLE